MASRWNLDAIEDAYRRWRKNPNDVDPSWRHFLEGFELASGPVGHAGVFRLVLTYRVLGHLLAHLDPVAQPSAGHPLLELSEFDLGEMDLDRSVETSPFIGLERATVRQLLEALRQTYCRTIGVEYMHIQDTHVRRWLQERMEPCRNRPELARRRMVRILMNLHHAELFERFIHTRYVGQKRFSLEGAETLIPLLDAILCRAAENQVEEIILGMAHRGRLNVLANILGKPYQEIFAEFEDVRFELPYSDGDVKYHLGFSSDWVSPQGVQIHLSLTPNPSHLESVNPVVEGRTRSKQEHSGDKEQKRIMPLLIHGDAAFAGQGMVAETFNLANLAGFTTGGTLHIIINNQIGFTTSPAAARSTFYCTDVAKMIQAPIFHVNAEDPEAAVFVAELAFDFRRTFHRDAVIDLYCYRRHGHNEGDEPAYTQPLLYRKIDERPTVSSIYTEQLNRRGNLDEEATTALKLEFKDKLQTAFKEIKGRKEPLTTTWQPGGRWTGLDYAYSADPVDTTVPVDRLQAIGKKLTQLPDHFEIHPKLAKQLETRRQTIEQQELIDWSLAEALAFGSLLLDGIPVRLTGQDSARGTFSQRHAVLTDINTGESTVPLSRLSPEQASFRVYDSALAEASILAFEFGYALDDPHRLVLWEAQFGDFANGAQVIIDQFLVCSEAKWRRMTGLVLLLPHGYEGQGPEHSSARLERFLQLFAEDNIQVANLTTPAQYFHVLRRQVLRSFRKPLILMTPKSLLRHKEAVSPWTDLTSGGFQEVLEPEGHEGKVRRVLLCSGKVFYDLCQARRDREISDVAIVRIEQLAPFPEQPLQRILKPFGEVREWCWVQEEPQNMGAWSFMEPRLEAIGYPVEYIGRDASASPAAGSHRIHEQEQERLVKAALEGPRHYLVRAWSDGQAVKREE